MAASYPAAIKSFTAVTDNVDDVLATHINQPYEEITAIETELGTNPKGSAASVAALLATLNTFYTDMLGGWITAGETWTYASASTFTISGDRTGVYQKGDKIKLTQTTVKYFYILSATYSAPNTTVTVTAGTDYTIANAAITANYFSKAATPQGFPDWFNYTITWAGFSSNPTGVISRFRLSGTLCTMVVRVGTPGTSNATSMTLTGPITSANIASMSWFGGVVGVDNGATLTTLSRVSMANNTTTINAYPTQSSSSTWTNSGGKAINGTFAYEI